MEPVYLTIGTLWKDEDSYAKDFVHYHRSIGVQRFVIYDREYNRIHDMFRDDADVFVKHFPDNEFNIHSTAWAGLLNDCQSRSMYPTKWLALIDADEVLVPVKTDDMKKVLKDYEDFAALQLNWHTFGSGGADEREAGSLYERFTMRAAPWEGINTHTQTIAQPDRCKAIKTADPHHVFVSDGEMAVNTRKDRVIGPFSKAPAHDIAWVGHYITKSRAEWAIKNAKGRADIWLEKMPFDMYEQHNSIANAEKEERVLELWNKANSR